MDPEVEVELLLKQIEDKKAELLLLRGKLSAARKKRNIVSGNVLHRNKTTAYINRVLSYLFQAIAIEQRKASEGAVTRQWIIDTLNAWIESPIQVQGDDLPQTLKYALNHDPRFGQFKDGQGNRVFYYAKD